VFPASSIHWLAMRRPHGADPLGADVSVKMSSSLYVAYVGAPPRRTSNARQVASHERSQDSAQLAMVERLSTAAGHQGPLVRRVGVLRTTCRPRLRQAFARGERDWADASAAVSSEEDEWSSLIDEARPDDAYRPHDVDAGSEAALVSAAAMPWRFLAGVSVFGVALTGTCPTILGLSLGSGVTAMSTSDHWLIQRHSNFEINENIHLLMQP
jgi:hypothetical protein